jgi:UDP-glucuronate 4-epimerase
MTSFKNKKILITGCAGFIGFHLSNRLLNLGFDVIGIDNINNYYSIKLKKDRLNLLSKYKNKFTFRKINISDKKNMNSLFKRFKPDIVVNLAAQAGVRDSLSNPEKYLKFNIIGFLNICELSRTYNIERLIYASTSSVYGLNEKLPYSITDNVDHPKQFYAVTKRTNELMAHTWSHLYNLTTVGLRFFTVYGPWGRPDMALYKFVENINKDKHINLFNHGNHFRDFTYIDDVVDGIYRSIFSKLPKNLKYRTDISVEPFHLYNIGSGRKTSLRKFLQLIEKNLNKKALINYLPLQPGDVIGTTADIKKTKKELGYNPSIKPEEGIKNFVNWYKEYK